LEAVKGRIAGDAVAHGEEQPPIGAVEGIQQVADFLADILRRAERGGFLLIKANMINDT
jgi:hypothetical protein